MNNNFVIDKVLILLKKTGIGCHINSCCTGAISYADGIILYLRHNLKMLKICNKWAMAFNHYYFIINFLDRRQCGNSLAL